MEFLPPDAHVAIRRVGSTSETGDSDMPAEGEVVAVGPGAEFLPPEVKVGDRVFFGKGAGTEIGPDGETLVVMKEADLMCVIGKTAARNAA